MKKSVNTDRQCVIRIHNYISELGQIINSYNIQSFQDLRRSLAAKYAVTQLITNIYELSKMLQEDTLKSLTVFDQIKIRTVRQLASHEYTKIDFKPVFEICRQLTSKSVLDELTKFYEEDTDDVSKQD